jgi:mono/diheme cytochrome c family protein
MQIGWRKLAAFGLLAVTLLMNTWSSRQAVAQDKASDESIKRGKYLVDVVARCGDCHTPRDAKGNLDMTRHLQGTKMWWKPDIKVAKWHEAVPDITLSGFATKWSEEKMINFFSTGVKADPPMPVYKMTVDDAKAVTAYLRSLPGKK